MIFIRFLIDCITWMTFSIMYDTLDKFIKT